jgi:hypothetical protein
MKIGLIYEKNDGVKESLFLSLKHMLRNLDVSFVSIDYIDSISLSPITFSFWNQLKHNLKIHRLNLRLYKFQTKANIIRRLRGCDVVIKMNVLPDAFIEGKFDVVNFIRNKLNVPILSYSNYFFGNRSIWPYLLSKMPNKVFGFDLYDYYLCSGEDSQFSLPETILHPYCVIGFNSQGLNIIHTRKESNPIVVVDFPQSGFEELRKFQLSILDEIGCERIVLEKKMSREKLYQIFEKSHVLFISSNESFGVPILEFQLAGGIIYTLPHFLPYHLINNANYGSNIITYSIDNRQELIDKLKTTFSLFNPKANRNNFENEYPNYFVGNLVELKGVLEKIKTGKINVNSHLQYSGFELHYANNTKNDVERNYPHLIDKLKKYDV